MMRGALFVLLLGALAAASACKNKRGSEGSGEPLSGFHEPIVGKLKKKGLAVGNMERTAADDYGATECVRGEVDRLEVLLCQYPTAEDATKSQQKLASFGRGAVSGAVRILGTTAIVVSDRQNVDLSGKKTQRLLHSLPAGPKATGSTEPAGGTASK